MTMRENIARAIYDVLEGPVNNADMKRQIAQWELSLSAADAVLDAMREPTPGMIEAAKRQMTTSYYREIWQAMIDAAKGEKK